VSAGPLRARTTDAEGTRALAGAIAPLARPGDVVLLVGDLGAGKTTFAQGFARGLGIQGPVTSPTFTLVRQYEVPVVDPAAAVEQLLHADVYRLDRLAEVTELALAELVEEAAVALVEWGESAAPALPPAVLTVELVAETEVGSEEPARVITIGALGGAWAERWGDLAQAVEAVRRKAR
jgi:tRNA threonylcarbamoyladenosine biosynthesis protein TsaE